jgi:hypothetical protein
MIEGIGSTWDAMSVAVFPGIFQLPSMSPATPDANRFGEFLFRPPVF